MSDLASMAARMYPDLAQAEALAEVPARDDALSAAQRLYPEFMPRATNPVTPTPEAPATPAAEQPAPVDEPVSVEDLVSRELSQAERFVAGGTYVPDSPEGYESVLGERFDHLERQARWDKSEEDVEALSEGRKEAAALMHELQVPRQEARELTQTLGDWVSKPALDEDANWDNKLTTLGALEKEWGKETQARIQLAQRTAAEACKRMPWLADLLESGAGNDVRLIKHFAEIGLRQARRARR